jgi:hypothetical protein
LDDVLDGTEPDRLPARRDKLDPGRRERRRQADVRQEAGRVLTGRELRIDAGHQRLLVTHADREHRSREAADHVRDARARAARLRQDVVERLAEFG